jgi:hypothetical protein
VSVVNTIANLKPRICEKMKIIDLSKLAELPDNESRVDTEIGGGCNAEDVLNTDGIQRNDER